jgi:hypothetical protein
MVLITSFLGRPGSLGRMSEDESPWWLPLVIFALVVGGCLLVIWHWAR